MRFPILAEVIACDEAVREPDEASPSAAADDDELDRAAALAYELTAAQGFYEGNKRTAVVIARWFLRANTAFDPAALIPSDDRALGDLLVRAARGEDAHDAIRALLHKRLDQCSVDRPEDLC